MTTEDRDIESANPSKNLTVGEFDRLSGFFTPVWESNRRVRTQPADANAPESFGAPSGADCIEASAGRASVNDRVGGKAAGSRSTASKSESVSKGDVAKSAGKGVPRGKGRGSKKSGAGSADPSPESVALATSAPEPEPSPALSTAADAGTTRSPEAAMANGGAAPAAPTAAGFLPSAGPSRVATALKHAGPNPPSEAFMDSEPEFRAPLPARPAPSLPRAERPAAHFRSLVASAAATAVHERLKATLTDELPIPESRSALDSFSEELRARATPEVMSWNDPYPPQLLRRLRRTLRLSTPLPEPVRAMLAKYARN